MPDTPYDYSHDGASTRAQTPDFCFRDDVDVLDSHLPERSKSRSRSASTGLLSSSPHSATGLSTPPILMPETPVRVVDRDLEYAATVQQLHCKDWAMWQRLVTAGLRCVEPEHDEMMTALPAQTSFEPDLFALEL